jgi:hypothetical protein
VNRQVSRPFNQDNEEDEIDRDFLKLLNNPKFDKLVKNYAIVYHPEWLSKENIYSGVSYFGNKYQSTVCGNVQRYLIFFVVSIVIFLGLSVVLK